MLAYVMAPFSSVRLCVRHKSDSVVVYNPGIMYYFPSKRLSKSRKQLCTIIQGLWLSDAKDIDEIPNDHPNGGAKYRWGRKTCDFLYR